AGGGVDADDPEPAEVALLLAPADVGEVARAVDGLLGRPVELALGEEVALGEGEDLLAPLAALASTLDSRHLTSLSAGPRGAARHASRRRRSPGSTTTTHCYPAASAAGSLTFSGRCCSPAVAVLDQQHPLYVGGIRGIHQRGPAQLPLPAGGLL